MWSNPLHLAYISALLCAFPATAETPLSAIDWLSDSVRTPALAASPAPQENDGTPAQPANIKISNLSGPTPDAIGLIPAKAAGLPRDIWGSSLSSVLAARLSVDRESMIPAMQGLLYSLLLAELVPPVDATPEGKLFKTRIDTLLSLGALQQAQEMLALSGTTDPALFRRAFDVALLLHTEDEACATLRDTPSLSPTFPARIFCLARGGDWQAAALSLQTGRALGFISEFEDKLLARFLDPALFEGQPRLEAPKKPSPLVFRMLEAIAEPIPTASLPRAFAWADLHANSGWRNQIIAAERLVRSGALDPNRLLGLYMDKKPAASGGVWDRVTAIQQLQQAIKGHDVEGAQAALEPAWREMAAAELEVPFAHLFAASLVKMHLKGKAADLAYEIVLLSDDYRKAAHIFPPHTERQLLLAAFARGAPGDLLGPSPLKNGLASALQQGFRANGVPVRLQSLVKDNRRGEALLRAIRLFNSGARGNLYELEDSIAFLRASGFEDTARRAALQLLILDRRG